MSQNGEHEEDDFVFKPATSPKLNESRNNIQKLSQQISKQSIQETIQSPQSVQSTHNTQVNNIRFPFLDDLILAKKKEMDLELNKLAKSRFEEFLEREKAADKRIEEEFQFQKGEPAAEANNKDDNKETSQFELLDKKEEEMFKEMKARAEKTWIEFKEEYMNSLEQMHKEQAVRLSLELQLQESLQASGSVFNRELFEKVVEKCGKGRGTAFGKEKMARFWEVLDKSYPKGSSGANSPSKLDEDKLLTSLLGL